MAAIHIWSPGAKFWRSNSGGGKTGHRCNSINLPDIVGWQANGLALAVECKTAYGKLTDEQYDFLRDTKIRGGLVAIYAPMVDDGLEDFYVFGDIPRQFIPISRRP